MRVVGGKTGADGKLFAAIVWTVPGGPAEKGGLQQGDKILEWCGVSLVGNFPILCYSGPLLNLILKYFLYRSIF